MPATWKLIIEDDAGKQIVVPFTREIITIGRKEGNTIRLTERNVSRNHAKLSKENGHVVVEDLKSFNGVKLNGDRIDGRVQVHEGDTIQIGDYHLALHTQDGAGNTLPGHGGGASSTNGPTENLRRGAAGVPEAAAGEDDEFAGDTQRWEPPPGQAPLQVGGLATVEDRAVSDEHTAPAPIVTVRTVESAPPKLATQGGFGADGGDTERVTMDMLAPLSAGKPSAIPPSSSSSSLLGGPSATLPTRPPPGRELELEPTVRQQASPAAVSMPTAPAVAQTPPLASSPQPPTTQPAPSAGAVPQVASGATASEFFGETRPEPRLPDRAPDSAPANGVGSNHAQKPPSSPPRTAALDAKNVVQEQTEAMKASPGGEDLTVPRLVVLNTIFAGSTFSLRAAEAVIGRTEDNDITIEHKSVSRNHAKIVREGDRVRILDLKSANGVLVNNEEVEQAVLRSGDVVELGRVKLRFVPIAERFSVSADEIERARIADAAGDDFESDAGTGVTNPVRKKEKAAFAAPSASYPVVEQGRSPWVYVAVGGAVVALLAVIAVFVLGRGDEKKTGDITPPPPPAPVVVATNTNPTPPAPTPPAPTPPPVEEKAAPVDDAAKAAEPPVTPPVEEKAAPDESHKSSSSSHSSSSSKKVSLNDALKAAKAALIMKDASSAIELLGPYDTSKDADVHRLLGVAYAQKHMTQAAAKHYREYLKLKPDAPDAEQVKKILDGVK